MQNVISLVEDAKYLFLTNKKNSGFILVLIAFASIARNYYPQKKFKDNEAFKLFYKDNNTLTLSVEYRGNLFLIEEILYKYIRYELIHEGDIPIDIEFMEESESTSISLRAGGAPEYKLKLGDGWFWFFTNVIDKYAIN